MTEIATVLVVGLLVVGAALLGGGAGIAITFYASRRAAHKLAGRLAADAFKAGVMHGLDVAEALVESGNTAPDTQAAFDLWLDHYAPTDSEVS